MVSKKVSLAVDPRFFTEVFELKRKEMQKKIGVPNLSQANFTKMIKSFNIREPKQNLSQFNTKIVRKKNVRI